MVDCVQICAGSECFIRSDRDRLHLLHGHLNDALATVTVTSCLCSMSAGPGAGAAADGLAEPRDYKTE